MERDEHVHREKEESEDPGQRGTDWQSRTPEKGAGTQVEEFSLKKREILPSPKQEERRYRWGLILLRMLMRKKFR